MDLTSAIDALEAASGTAEARRILASVRLTPGLGNAFAERVVKRLGESHAAARKLARRWPMVLRYSDEAAPVHRVEGIADRLDGQWERSAEAFRRAGRAAQDPVQRLALQAGAVDGLARAGRVREAVRLGDRLARGLRKLGAEDQAARVDTNVGNALLWIDAYEAARKRLARALPHLQGAEAASAGLALSTAELFGGDPAHAHGHAEAARDAFLAAGLGHYAELCDVNLAQADLMRGRADEALDRLLALRANLNDHPAERGRILEFLGDAYLRLNLYEEAVSSYREALRATRGAPLNRANCRLGIGMAAAELGDVRLARRSLMAAEVGYRALDNLVWAADASIALARLEARTGNAAGAARRAAHAEREMRAAGPYHRARAKLLAASLGTGSGLHRTLEVARRYGFGDLEWQVHWLRAVRGRGARRVPEFRRMLECLLEARLLTRSTVSRSSFLRDKSRALSDYLSTLLDRPTPERVREALAVVAKCRSAALIDEVLAARSSTLETDVKMRLEELRADLAALGVDESPGGGRRRVANNGRAADLRTRWLALTRDAQRLTGASTKSTSGDTLVFVEAGETYFAVRGERAIRMPWTRRELASKMRWLQFELSAPLAEGPLADGGPAEALLRDLAEPMLELAEGATGVAPDGLLWSLPFSALDPGREHVVLPSPAFAAPTTTLPSRPSAALWYFAPPDLPEVRREAEAFLERFPDATVCRTAIEARRVLDGPDIDLLHVATHATFRRSNPMFSSLWLEDGAVFATEIARARVQIGLATLSACDTGAVALATREEPDGFVRAFLARGARCVLASLWPLDDQIAPVVMSHYYQALCAGRDAREALLLARTAARLQRSHPYYWGGLALFGGYHKEN